MVVHCLELGCIELYIPFDLKISLGPPDVPQASLVQPKTFLLLVVWYVYSSFTFFSYALYIIVYHVYSTCRWERGQHWVSSCCLHCIARTAGPDTGWDQRSLPTSPAPRWSFSRSFAGRGFAQTGSTSLSQLTPLSMTWGWWGQRAQQTWWRWLWQDDEHLNDWVKLGTVADALQVAPTVSAQTLVPDKRFATGSKIMLVSTSSHLQWALTSYFISCLEMLRIRMRFLPRHDLVSSEHSKGRRLACPVHTKQAKALLNQKWLVIGYW